MVSKLTRNTQYHDFIIPEIFTLTVTPWNFNASMELSATMYFTHKIENWSYTNTLYSKAIPHTGITIPGLLKMGLNISYQFAAISRLRAFTTLDFGVAAYIPSGAVLTLDLLDENGKSGCVGCDDSYFVPIFDVKKFAGDIQFLVRTEPKLTYGIKVMEKVELDVMLSFYIPQLDFSIKAGYGET